MERRKFLIGLGALSAGSATAIGTGAFSSAEVERGFDVNVVGDKDAYLKLEDTSEYAEKDGNQLFINFDENSSDGEGLNEDSVYEFHDVFKIKNQGEKDNIAVGARFNPDEGTDVEPVNMFVTSTSEDVDDKNMTYNVEQAIDFDGDWAPQSEEEDGEEEDGRDPEDLPQIDSGEYVEVGMDIRVDDGDIDYSGTIDIAAIDPDDV